MNMATIVIKDLSESVDLDRKAMREITGGWAGPRMKLPAYRSSFFQPPQSSLDLRLVSFEYESGSK
jgi:hypothetical protein